MNFEEFIEFTINKGFFWPSFEIYRGKTEVGGFYDYGPLGTYLKNNIIEKWRKIFIYPYQDFIVEIETPIIMPKIVFEASGHLEHFTDYIVECSKCGRKFRADHVIEEQLIEKGIKLKLEGLNEEQLYEIIIKYDIKCPLCGGNFIKPTKFNLLFQTIIGPYSSSIGYLRPETAQGMFVSFPRIYELMGKKLPLGIAQIGKVARNEISPRQGLIRLREFSQMEIELFFDPKNSKCPYLEDIKDVKIRILPEDDVAKGIEKPKEVKPKEAVDKGYVANEWMVFFMALATIFLNELGIPLDKQMFIGKLPEERAHYAIQVFDQLVKTERFGWIEVSGHAYRTDYDLSRHKMYSGYDIYAERRLEKPIEIEEIRIYPNPQKIREVYGKDAGKVMKILSEQNPKEIYEKINNYGKIVIEGYEITKDMIFARIEKRKVWVEKFIPHVVEPSFGIDRLVYVTLENAYTKIDNKIVLRLPPDIAPIKVVILPIVRKEPYISIGKNLWKNLAKLGYVVVYDDDGSIGFRYSKYDEIGVPYAITIDEETPKDNTITIRDRDTKWQIRTPISMVSEILRKAIFEKVNIIEIGKNMGLKIIQHE